MHTSYKTNWAHDIVHTWSGVILTSKLCQHRNWPILECNKRSSLGLIYQIENQTLFHLKTYSSSVKERIGFSEKIIRLSIQNTKRSV